MSISCKQIIGFGLLGAVLTAAACSPKRLPPTTVSDLMEDRVALDGILMKCNRNPGAARSDVDCLTARIAIERLAAAQEAVEAAKRSADFERRRDQLRLAQDKQRLQQEAAHKVDAYNLPVIPVDPTPAPAQSSHPQ
jgi:hypothetical protein